MEAPLCKICDPPRRHWASEPHHVNERPAKVAGETLVADTTSPIKAKIAPTASVLSPAGRGAVRAVTSVKLGRPRIHPDRKLYKREKERERRAKLKAKRNG